VGIVEDVSRDLIPHALAADDGELLVFGDVKVLIRVPAAASGGAFSLFEEVPPLLDTPLHVHEVSSQAHTTWELWGRTRTRPRREITGSPGCS
jgi:hypothetical protein